MLRILSCVKHTLSKSYVTGTVQLLGEYLWWLHSVFILRNFSACVNIQDSARLDKVVDVHYHDATEHSSYCIYKEKR